jgi:copper(I)-binding protein
VTFAPGGYHVMFTGLKAPLAPGGKLPATLTFRRGAKKIVLPVTFNVPAAPPSTSEHAH